MTALGSIGESCEHRFHLHDDTSFTVNLVSHAFPREAVAHSRV